ncbi:DMP19 family protein [Deinococcus hopiensis]|uniref:DNA mimic protein DMP19 C-terminal domain-containing protein n=1 Tax=Deinococcus hopiensis KR-140 TaxID=695939 RepID=A0A1W1UCW0_9DEIO|nr:hypothetical protein [Deinococcus hopiensis]SMB78938.1 hypothetical protein SAMN00790413_05701 [Deinococcus hopiensis KR-140]
MDQNFRLLIDVHELPVVRLALRALRGKTRGEGLEEFLARLNEDTRLAVMAWWMDDQVKSGGFAQWHANGYSRHTSLLAAYYVGKGLFCDRVANILRRVHWNLQDEDGPDSSGLLALSQEYFLISDEAFVELSRHLPQANQ